MSENDKGNSTAMWDFGLLGLIILVFLLALSEGTRPFAIGLGVGVPFGLGVLLLVVAMIDRTTKGKMEMDTSTITMILTVLAMAGVALLALSPATRPFAIALGISVAVIGALIFVIVGAMAAISGLGAARQDHDFSSLPPQEEQLFVAHEHAMLANSKASNMIGFGVAGVVFVIALAITGAGYTPCYKYCKHTPTTCKTDQQVADFKASCESACGNLEGMSGLTLLKPVEGGETEGEGSQAHKKLAPRAVGGKEYVEQLEACNFANGAGETCDEPVKRALGLKLWCPEN